MKVPESSLWPEASFAATVFVVLSSGWRPTRHGGVSGIASFNTAFSSDLGGALHRNLSLILGLSVTLSVARP